MPTREELNAQFYEAAQKGIAECRSEALEGAAAAKNGARLVFNEL